MGPEQEPLLDELTEALEAVLEHQFLNKMEYYQPTPKWLGIHQSPKLKKWVSGANGVGKTTGGAMEVIWGATATHPYRRMTRGEDWWAISPSFENSVDVAQRKIFEYLPAGRIKHFNRELRVLQVYAEHGTVGSIGFKSGDQDPKKYAGSRKDGVWGDEPLPQPVYRECMARQRPDSPLRFICSFTPVPGMEDWIATDIEDPWAEGDEKFSDHEFWYLDMDDNPHTDEHTKKALRDAFEGTREADARLRGRSTARASLMYPTFKRGLHVVHPFRLDPEEWAIFHGIDPHPQVPIHHLYLGAHQSGHYAIVGEHISPKDGTYKTIADALFSYEKARFGALMVPRFRTMDTYANAPTIERNRRTSMQRELAAVGIKTRPAVKDFPTAHRIVEQLLYPRKFYDDTLKREIMEPLLTVFDDCLEAIWELEHNIWDEFQNPENQDPKGTPKKKRKHMMDCLRYIMILRPRFSLARPTGNLNEMMRRSEVPPIATRRGYYA